MAKIVDKSERRSEILAAATRVFSRTGYADTLIQTIASEAGLGKGTIYEYFESKEDIFLSVCENIVTWPDFSRDDDGPPADLFANAIESIVAAYESSESFFLVVVDFWSVALRGEGTRDKFLNRSHLFYEAPRDALIRIIRMGQRRKVFRADADPAVITALAIAGVEGLRVQKVLDPSHLDFNACVRTHTRMLLQELTRKPD